MRDMQQLYDIKRRSPNNPLALCLAAVDDVPRYGQCTHLPDGLLEALLPGKVTVLLHKNSSAPVAAELNFGAPVVGIRVPDSNFLREVIGKLGSAIALTSANISSQESTTDIHEFEEVWKDCAYIFDAGQISEDRLGSTVVDLTRSGQYSILREGSSFDDTVATLAKFGLMSNR